MAAAATQSYLRMALASPTSTNGTPVSVSTAKPCGKIHTFVLASSASHPHPLQLPKLLLHLPQPPTTTGNGVTTPTPTQPGMVNNCNRFYFAKVGESCTDLLKTNGITLADFAKWNTGVGNNCQNMWDDTYHCVRVIGFVPPPSSTVRPPTTTTKPGNGITTPLPTQVGMVSNCNKFEYVDENEYCYDITTKYKITQANFVAWNPAAKSDCSGLWARTYACVGVIS